MKTLLMLFALFSIVKGWTTFHKNLNFYKQPAAPMPCEATEFGCCWDKISFSGPSGKGCPECKDMDRCPKDKKYCDLIEIRGSCPVTCQVRGCLKGNCYDDPSQSGSCYFYKKGGFCVTKKPLMKQICRKTCNLCKQSPSAFSKVIQAKKNDDDDLMSILKKEVNDDSKQKKKETADQDLLDILLKEHKKA
ncbi:uncharacterized protein LOC130623755 [Hydractinia symbiolongicarpus]|uniref:uncharacterized protein LOC130623755 n=1 Tax=Hydractinia symbiolongicarpus TaxID=13093 RepID=UPI00255172A3|nr:uncharacterized protein LOC130623755 [Hydractinia symbiolongicarpus]XP_057295256.1 uncharacterized protein LOC130623755 [Hydractinia symbiolongicarpus]